MKLSKRDLRLHDSLTRGASEEEKKLIENSFKASTTFLRALGDRLDKVLDDKIRESESVASYLTLNWSESQADNRGYRRAIRDVLNLFNERKQD